MMERLLHYSKVWRFVDSPQHHVPFFIQLKHKHLCGWSFCLLISSGVWTIKLTRIVDRRSSPYHYIKPLWPVFHMSLPKRTEQTRMQPLVQSMNIAMIWYHRALFVTSLVPGISLLTVSAGPGPAWCQLLLKGLGSLRVVCIPMSTTLIYLVHHCAVVVQDVKLQHALIIIQDVVPRTAAWAVCTCWTEMLMHTSSM